MVSQRGVSSDNRVHDSDFDDCDALLEGRMGEGWQLFFQSPDVQIRRRVTEGSSLTEFRLDGIIPFPAQLFFEMLTCLEYRRVYDKFTTEIRRLPGPLGEPDSEAIYWRLKLPLLAERDYVFLRRITFETATQTYRLVSLSATYGAAAKAKPPIDGVVRVEQYVSKAVMRPRGPDACEYHLLASQDLKGNVPSMVIDFFASKGLAAMVGGHRKACASFLAWKAAYRGEIMRVKLGRYAGEQERLEEAEAEAAAPSGAAQEGLGAGTAAEGGDGAEPSGRAQPTLPSPTPGPGSNSFGRGQPGACSGGEGVPASSANSSACSSSCAPGSASRAQRMMAGMKSRLEAKLEGAAVQTLERRVGMMKRLKAGVTHLDASLATAISRAAGDVASRHADGSGGNGGGAQPQSASSVTQDYLELLSGAPVRLTQVAAPQQPAAAHRAARHSSAQGLPGQQPGPHHGGCAGPHAQLPHAHSVGAHCYAQGGHCSAACLQQLAAPSLCTLADASLSHRSSEASALLPAPAVGALDQMRLGAVYVTQRGTLVRRTSLTSALLANTIELVVHPRADAPPLPLGGLPALPPLPLVTSFEAEGRGQRSGLGLGVGIGIGIGRCNSTESLGGSSIASEAVSESAAFSAGSHLRALERARRAIEGRLGRRQQRGVSASAPPKPSPAPDPLDAELDALELRVICAEDYYQKRVNAERRDDVSAGAALSRVAAAEERFLELEDGMLALKRGGYPAARQLLTALEAYGPVLLEQHGSMRSRISHMSGPRLVVQTNLPQLTLSERLALKLGI